MNKRLAIFDVDGTIYRWGLIFELYKQFVRHGLFPKEVMNETVDSYLGWLDRKNDFSEYDKKVTALFQRYAVGVSEKAALQIADEIVEKKKYRVYRFPIHLIKQLKEQDFYIVLISGSPSFIVKRLAQELGCDRAYGQLYEVVDGKFTGKINFGEMEVQPEIHLDKSVLVKRVLDVVPFEVDLSESIAMGDTRSDIPLLEMVGKPIAFNPTKELLAEAQLRGWRIVVERKDMIYDIEKFTSIQI
jgi:HAD superfamily hydrolase (TIGR01490 family)